MKRVELIQSPVQFDSEAHEYWLGEKQLSGITKMLQRQLFPDEYDGISEAVLEAAAEYGSNVHKSLELFDASWFNDGSVEVSDYIQLIGQLNLVHEASEYLVSDNKDWASSIDKVYRTGDNTFILGDIKTYDVMTSEKMEKTRWQLSIYAYMFELQNKGAVVDELYIIRLRYKEGKDHVAEAMPVKRIPSDICKDLLCADLIGEQFTNPYLIPQDIKEKESLIRQLIHTKQEAEERLTTIKQEILSEMEAQGVKSWQTDTMRITRKLPTTRSTFNLTAYKKDNPELDLTDYMKTSEVAGSLLIAV